MTKHIAHTMPFDDLMAGLNAAVAEKHVREQVGPDGLRLYVYSEAAVYDRIWTPFTMAARGLVLHPETKRIVATPFAKFFNAGEHGDDNIPALPFEVFDKLDGSLIIIYWFADRWNAVTKGSFNSVQAQWAQDRLNEGWADGLPLGYTYLAEFTGPSNRIVARYAEDRLVLLGSYGNDGIEMPRAQLERWSLDTGHPITPARSFSSIVDLIEHSHGLPMDEEGFVIRFENGYRLKVKGDEYRRIHAMVSRLSPLSVYEAMLAGDDLDAFRRELPEEFWQDHDGIRGALDTLVDGMVGEIASAYEAAANLTDKELGLTLDSYPDRVRKFLFPYRKSGGNLLKDGKARESLFRVIRPTGNRLPGYVPSFSLNRAQDELLG